MPCRRLAYATADDHRQLQQLLQARRQSDAGVEASVRDILDQVERRGDQALLDYARRFDCPEFSLERLRVPAEALATARGQVDPADMSLVAEAADHIRAFHAAQKVQSWWTTAPDGTILGQLVRPVDRAGLYVPGGQGGMTPLLSSLLMNAIPAQVAGVAEICVVSPPRSDGSLNPMILATAHLLGIHEVYAVGSAWAVAALALGTATIRAVDVIAGPGNIYVTTAKRLCIGRVGIDMIAGPSEIAILADASANPDWIAADMLSQAEHDPLAACILVTDAPGLADAVFQALDRRLSELPRSDIAAQALAQWGALVVVPSLEAGCQVVNAIAPEHLEVLTQDPWSLLGRIRHAGAIFLGPHSPEPLGDYFAGPNHVLPTLGTARFSSALSVETFCKKSSLIAGSAARIQRDGTKIARLARLEGLEAHARSAECRLTPPEEP